MWIVFKQNNYLLLVKETVKFLSPENVNRKNIELCRTGIMLQKRKKIEKTRQKLQKTGSSNDNEKLSCTGQLFLFDLSNQNLSPKLLETKSESRKVICAVF